LSRASLDRHHVPDLVGLKKGGTGHKRTGYLSTKKLNIGKYNSCTVLLAPEARGHRKTRKFRSFSARYKVLYIKTGVAVPAAGGRYSANRYFTCREKKQKSGGIHQNSEGSAQNNARAHRGLSCRPHCDRPRKRWRSYVSPPVLMNVIF
jgi:hypothetical protein